MKKRQLESISSLKKDIDEFIKQHSINTQLISKAEQLRLFMPIILEHKDRDDNLRYKSIVDVLLSYGIETTKQMMATRIFRERELNDLSKKP